MSKDYYNILGVDKKASKDEIKKAFHKLAHKYHPDKKEGDANKFKEVNEAYQTLSDDTKRAKYDQFGSNYQNMGGAGGAYQGGFGGFEGFDFSNFSQGFGQGGVEFDLGDIFNDFFGGGAGGRAQARRGRDISTEIQVSFSEAIFGTTRRILITKTSECISCRGSGAKPGVGTEKCKKCNGQGKIRDIKHTILGNISTTRNCDDCTGTGEVPKEFCEKCKGRGVLRREEEISITIPAGIRDGEMVRMSGMGEAITRGTAGDLYIKINIAKHPTFVRDGSDLVMDLHLKLSEALLGKEIDIDTLDGTMKVKVPEGVSVGEILRIKGKGVPKGKGIRGDLLIKLHIDMPKKLSRKSRELIEELKKEGI